MNKKKPITKINNPEVDINTEILPNVQGSIMHIKLGNDENIFSLEDVSVLEDLMQEKLQKKGINNVIVFATPHFCDIQIIK